MEPIRSEPHYRVFRFKLPMRIRTSSKKQTALNLNIYRNLHFRSLSSQKNHFHKLMEKLLKDVPPLGKVRLHYDICPRTKGRLDVMNVGSIVDKYFSDCLTEMGIIEDDDYNVIDFCSFGFGGLAKEEHVLVTITETEPRKENAMRLLLDEDEIQKALETYVATLNITGANGVEIDTDEDGNITAEVMIGDVTTVKARAPRKNKGGRPRGSKNKPKEPEEDVDTPDEGSDADSGSGNSDTSESKAEETSDQKESTPKSKEGGNSKNLFGESDEESSKTSENDTPETEDEGTGDSEAEQVKPAKKSSIFDQ